MLNEARVYITSLALQPVRVIHGAATCQRKERTMQRGYCVIQHGYCNRYTATKKDQQALRFLFGRDSMESESLELDLESAKTFACHMLLGE